MNANDHLNTVLKGVLVLATDDDLIQELRQRARLLHFSQSHAFWREMTDEDGYMRAIRGSITASLVRTLTDHNRQPIRETIHPSTQNIRENILTRDVIVLCPQGLREDGL